MRDPFLLEWVSFSSYSAREPQRKIEIISVFSLSAEEKENRQIIMYRLSGSSDNP